MAGQRYDKYDPIAWCYSRGWGKDFHERMPAVLHDWVFPRLAPGARVLDLCCGSGDLTVPLQAAGFKVTGLDGSAEMLAFARARVPEAEFILADARNFHFENKFDAVLSTFDSLNHILVLEELECAFRNVHNALVDGGLFMFDMNMQESFETLWQGTFATVEPEYVTLTRGRYDVEEKIGRAQITTFRQQQEGVWTRADVEVLERCYTEAEILNALERAGFTSITVRDAYEVGMRGANALGRAFFFAVK
ncbi:MAG TPA: class I SAM-dependent methyltransferase [Bryobacteraceae bacterium]|nr:class I SAM-dependent methyltransferase [Bryobacteraceae bacterium]HPQ13999.1 class I SAM-dependent methyltransferase [Bryobacteraceae bacterium]